MAPPLATLNTKVERGADRVHCLTLVSPLSSHPGAVFSLLQEGLLRICIRYCTCAPVEPTLPPSLSSSAWRLSAYQQVLLFLLSDTRSWYAYACIYPLCAGCDTIAGRVGSNRGRAIAHSVSVASSSASLTTSAWPGLSKVSRPCFSATCLFFCTTTELNGIRQPQNATVHTSIYVRSVFAVVLEAVSYLS